MDSIEPSGLPSTRSSYCGPRPVTKSLKWPLLFKRLGTPDVEAFLATFERTAEREGWPQDQWAGLIAPFLTGDPQKAYFDLPPDDAKDYCDAIAYMLQSNALPANLMLLVTGTGVLCAIHLSL